MLSMPCCTHKADWALQARMRDPVIASDGVCYERAAIEGAVSPTTNKAITADLIPNHSLRSLLQALQQRS
jgi:U-box domain